MDDTPVADEAAKSAARQKLSLALAKLRQKEVLVRAAFVSAGVTFEPMPKISEPK